MKIHLHIGVHKTATTWLQSRLEERQWELNGQGVGFKPLVPFRTSVTHLLAFLEPDVFASDATLDGFFKHGRPAEVRGVVMSDENLIGAPAEFVLSGKLYEAGVERLARLRGLLAAHEVTLFICVRSYETFIASMYCEAIRHTRKFHFFRDFEKRLDLRTCRWPALISRFAAALAPCDVVVWRFEDFSATSAAILKALAFDTDVGFETKGAQRASFSATSIDILTRVAKRHGRLLAGQLVNPIADALPKGDGLDGFDPWSRARRDELRAMYEADCRTLPAPLQASRVPPPAAVPRRRWPLRP